MMVGERLAPTKKAAHLVLCGRLDMPWSGQRLDPRPDPTAPTFTMDIVIGIIVGVVGAVGDQGQANRLVQARPTGFCVRCRQVRVALHVLVSNWPELYHPTGQPSKMNLKTTALLDQGSTSSAACVV
jgi:hypothetical protein